MDFISGLPQIFIYLFVGVICTFIGFIIAKKCKLSLKRTRLVTALFFVFSTLLTSEVIIPWFRIFSLNYYLKKEPPRDYGDIVLVKARATWGVLHYYYDIKNIRDDASVAPSENLSVDSKIDGLVVALADNLKKQRCAVLESYDEFTALQFIYTYKGQTRVSELYRSDCPLPKTASNIPGLRKF